MPQLNQATLAAQSAGGADVVTSLGEVAASLSPQPVISAVRITSPSLVSGQVANFVTLTVRRYRAGALVETVASIALSAAGVNLPAMVAVDVPVTGSPRPVAGDTFDVLQHQTGTGLATPVGVAVQVEIS